MLWDGPIMQRLWDGLITHLGRRSHNRDPNPPPTPGAGPSHDPPLARHPTTHPWFAPSRHWATRDLYRIFRVTRGGRTHPLVD